MDIESWSGVGAYRKISGTEASTFPDFKIIINHVISNTGYDVKKFLTNLSENANFQNSIKIPSLNISVVEFLFKG